LRRFASALRLQASSMTLFASSMSLRASCMTLEASAVGLFCLSDEASGHQRWPSRRRCRGFSPPRSGSQPGRPGREPTGARRRTGCALRARPRTPCPDRGPAGAGANSVRFAGKRTKSVHARQRRRPPLQ
jgi:hypothetical protein